ncbi:MAG: DNA repair protein RecN, partial [Bifidobacteriaceae bacterium]|nr:DNA repair protein RecN [Bifidobacteriaceae bacterium]
MTAVLCELSVADLGVIAAARLDFAPAFTVVTGETGAGKTMLLTAIGLLRGAKADPALVRAGAPRALVEGAFALPDGHPALAAAGAAGGLAEDGELLVSRVVAGRGGSGGSSGGGGRSRAVVGGCSVPAAALAAVVEPLITVHGQADQMRLRSAAQQREVLDGYAGPEHAAALEAYREAHALTRRLEEQIERLSNQGREAAREAEMLAFSLAEIRRVAPEPGEETALAERIERLAHAEELRLAAAEARGALIGDDMAGAGGADDAAALVGRAQRALESGARRDPALEALAQRLAEVGYQLA